jgi:hypothetical protein
LFQENAISTTKTTDNFSFISLVVLKADIMCRLQTLAFGLQNEQRHHMFKPGETWWVSSLGGGWRKKHSEAQRICEQLGITVSDMILAFDKRWTEDNGGIPFNLFRS